MPDSPTVIGRKPQLFVDNHLVQYVNFVTRTAHQLHRYEGNPSYGRTSPGRFSRTSATMCRPLGRAARGCSKSGTRTWAGTTRSSYASQRSGRGRTRDQVAAMPSLERTLDNRLLYAESADGITWVKPELDYRLVDGMRTNITLGNETDGKVHAPTIVRDSIDPDESRRYKVMYWNCHRGLDDSRIAVASSPDGRNWTPEEELLSIGQMRERQLGDVIFLSSDESTGLYYLDARARTMQEPPVNPNHPTVPGWGPAYFPHDPWRMSKRRVFSSVSHSVLNWPVLQESIVPDDILDNLDDEFYGLARFRVGDLWLGLMPIFHRTYNTVDLHLLYSPMASRGFVSTGPNLCWPTRPKASGTATCQRWAWRRFSSRTRSGSTIVAPTSTTTGGNSGR